MLLNIFKTGNAILNYHRVCPDNDMSKPNNELVVSASKFKEQLIFLKKNYNLVSLDNLLDFKKNKKFNISITFDDGYKDNLTYALPILNILPTTIVSLSQPYSNLSQLLISESGTRGPSPLIVVSSCLAMDG